MKILNPLYDECMRWNYSILKGWLYKFPKNATYTINDQVYIEKMTDAVVTDLFTLNKQQLILTRKLKIDNKTFFSRAEINNDNFVLDNRYCELRLDVTYQGPYIKHVSYAYTFWIHSAEKMRIQVLVPWHLVFSESIIPNFGGFSYESAPTSGAVRFTIIEPELWITCVIILVIIIVVLICYKRKSMG